MKQAITLGIIYFVLLVGGKNLEAQTSEFSESDSRYIKTQLHLLPEYFEITGERDLDFKQGSPSTDGSISVYFQNSKALWNLKETDLTLPLCRMKLSSPEANGATPRPHLTAKQKINVNASQSRIVTDLKDDIIASPFLSISISVELSKKAGSKNDALQGNIDCGYGYLNGSPLTSAADAAEATHWTPIAQYLLAVHTTEKLKCVYDEDSYGTHLRRASDNYRLGDRPFYGNDDCPNTILAYEQTTHLSPVVCAPSIEAESYNLRFALFNAANADRIQSDSYDFEDLNTCQVFMKHQNAQLICSPTHEVLATMLDLKSRTKIPTFYLGKHVADCLNDVMNAQSRFVCVPNVQSPKFVYRVWDRKNERFLDREFADGSTACYAFAKSIPQE